MTVTRNDDVTTKEIERMVDATLLIERRVRDQMMEETIKDLVNLGASLSEMTIVHCGTRESLKLGETLVLEVWSELDGDRILIKARKRE